MSASSYIGERAAAEQQLPTPREVSLWYPVETKQTDVRFKYLRIGLAKLNQFSSLTKQ
jgi:hypothetical protein